MTDQQPKKHQSWLCEKCGHEATTHEEYKQHKVDHQLGKVNEAGEMPAGEPVKPEELQPKPEVIEAKPQPDPDRKPITLTYVFTGNCAQCGKVVDTLELDVAGKHFCIAFCTACKKDRASREVAKL